MVAALTQTARNSIQRDLVARAGTLGATLSRFMFGLPLSAMIVIVMLAIGDAPRLPNFNGPYAMWIALAATVQVAATAFLLLAMRERNFLVGVTYSKTDALQVVAFSALFLSEIPTSFAIGSMALATIGVLILNWPRSTRLSEGGGGGCALVYGLGSGACFALASVSFRAASLSLGPEVRPWESGAWNLLWSQVAQTALLGGYMARYHPLALSNLFACRRTALAAGSTGAIASFAWFTAYAMQPASDVRTLGLVEVLFSLWVSHSLMKERATPTEWLGLIFVCIGILGVCVSAI